MKRIIVLVLALCMCLSLFACGKSEEVKATEEAIAAIGTVTISSGYAISDAQKLYNNLTDEDKEKVKNASVLTEAVITYEDAVVNNIANASVGDIVVFGSYKTEGYAEAGAYPLKWLVLDKRDGEVLLMSYYVVDCQKFSTNTNVWQDSKIREWLNGDFLSAAFSESERSYVAETELTTTTGFYKEDPIITTDKVFLLSEEELEKYLPGKDNDNRIAGATNHAISEGIEVYGARGNLFSCNWWLRSGFGRDVQWVGGQLGNAGEVCDLPGYENYGVRPVIWVSIG